MVFGPSPVQVLVQLFELPELFFERADDRLDGLVAEVKVAFCPLFVLFEELFGGFQELFGRSVEHFGREGLERVFEVLLKLLQVLDPLQVVLVALFVLGPLRARLDPELAQGVALLGQFFLDFLDAIGPELVLPLGGGEQGLGLCRLALGHQPSGQDPDQCPTQKTNNQRNDIHRDILTYW